LLLGSWVCPSHATEVETCPQNLLGQYSAGTYVFDYQSWTKQVDGQFLYYYCIHNGHPTRDTFFDWRGTGLSGFVKAGGYAYSTQPFATDDTLDLSRPLCFGALPKRIDVGTKLHRLLEQRSSIFESEHLIHLTQFQATSRTDKQELVSTAQIFLPRPEVLTRLGDRSKKDVIEFIEQAPGALYGLRMTFTSRVEKAADGSTVLNHECDWAGGPDTDKLRYEQPQVYAQIDDGALHQLIIGDRKHSEDLWTWQPGDTSLNGKEENVSPGAITGESARMNLVLENGAVLASIPISFWRGAATHH